MSETVTDQDTLRTIRAFSLAVNKHNDEPIEAKGASVINGETTNRGNKLKLGASSVHRDQLMGYSRGPAVKQVVIDGEEREYIARKRKYEEEEEEEEVKQKKSKKQQQQREKGESAVEDDEDEENDDSNVKQEDDDGAEDPYQSIDIKQILAPISKPEEAVTNPATSRIFQDNSLRDLAGQAIDIIEYEQANSNSLAHLMELFLGEDPKFLKVENMRLPDYDHELADGESVEELNFKNTKHKNDLVIEALHDTGSTNNVKTEEYLSSLQHNENKRITRNVDSNYQEVDPFFALPQFEVDPNNGVDPQVANEIRQIVQISLQRNREYIRLLQKIRMGLIRAERMKDQVFKWCREMNGDYDSEVSALLVPSSSSSTTAGGKKGINGNE